MTLALILANVIGTVLLVAAEYRSPAAIDERGRKMPLKMPDRNPGDLQQCTILGL